MLEFDRVDVSEGIDVNKSNVLRDCIICVYWEFLEINFRFDPKVCYACHDLMQKIMSFNDIAIISVKELIFGI